MSRFVDPYTAFVVDRPEARNARADFRALKRLARSPVWEHLEALAGENATVKERERILAIAARLFPACDVDTLRTEVER